MIKIRQGILLFIGIVLAGWFCNIIAFSLPHDPIHQNIADSSITLMREGPFSPVIGEKYRNSIADNNTDAWMLLMADYDGEEGVLKKSLGGFYKTYKDTSNTNMWGFDNFVSSNHENAEQIGIASYSRYWHGWLLPLRLLLLVFDYEDIRYINMCILMILIVSCAFIMSKEKLNFHMLAYGAAGLFVLPVTAMISFEYAFVYYITLLSIIIMLKFYDRINKGIGFSLFFMILGMMIGYFDFLTYPIVSLGFSSLMYLILSNRDNSLKVIKGIKAIILYSIMWGIGYCGMWFSKWLIGSLVLGGDVFRNAISQLILRTSETSDGVSEHVISYVEVLKRNLVVFKTQGFVFVFLLVFIYFIYHILKQKAYRISMQQFQMAIPYFMVFCMPFAWSFIFQNHTFIHFNFTSNIFVVSLLAGFGYLSYLLSSKQKN